MTNPPSERRVADRRRGDRRRRGAPMRADLSRLQPRLEDLEALPPAALAKVDQLCACIRDELLALGVDTADRRRMEDVAFGVMVLADAVDRAVEMGGFDDEVRDTLRGTIDWVLRLLGPLSPD